MAVKAVFMRSTTPTGIVMKFQMHEGLTIGVVATNANTEFPTPPGGENLAGQGPGQGAKDGLGDTPGAKRPCRHSGRMHRVDKGAFWGYHVNGPEVTAVVRNSGIEDAAN